MRAHENPFRTSRVTALAYRGEDVAAVLTRLKAAGWRGSIVGPPGSGKSTLLHELAEAAAVEGDALQVIRFDDVRGLARALMMRTSIVGVDGAERVPQPLRTALVLCLRRIVITAHAPVLGIGVLARSRTTPQLMRRLLADLGVDHLDDREVEHVFARSDGDLRRAFLTLYDDTRHAFGGAFRAR